MRVLIHSDEYYPTSQACSYRMQVLVDSFLANGDIVTVITSSANKSNGKISRDQHKERILYSPAIRMKKKTTIRRFLNNISFGFSSLLASIGAGKTDVVITTAPPLLISISGWMIAKCKRAKLVYDVRDIWPDVALEMGSFTEMSFFCKVFRRIARFMYKHADVVTTVSPRKVEKIKEYVSQSTGKKAGPSHIDKVWYVGNGFDETILKNEVDQQIINEFELDTRETCVYIGNIGLAQGLDILVDLAAHTKHQEMQFLCFGKGAEKDNLEKSVKERGLSNIKFCGVIEHSKVFTVLSCAKLSFISLKNSNMKDSVPTKLYEALGIGCPVFLVAEGDSTVIVEETRFGRYISPDAITTLVDEFDDLIDHYDDIYSRKEYANYIVQSRYSRQKIAIDFNRKLHFVCDK